jgi:hypothetical protein
MSDPRKELIDFLDRNAFDPVLHTDESRVSTSDKDVLRDVKQRTERERKRYHDEYGSASEIRRRFSTTSARRRPSM